jgi:hypothetical protein
MRSVTRAVALACLIGSLNHWACAQPGVDAEAGGSGGWMAHALTAVGILAAVGIVGTGIMVLFIRGRRPPELDTIYLEPVVVGSRFEQLLSEIQGLWLRVQGGESKGYYRKIEQLLRVFLERIGHKDARRMDDKQIEALLASGEIQQDLAAELRSIFQRCKQGASHETEKLDFSAAELLKDLRAIIKRVEQAPARP